MQKQNDELTIKKADGHIPTKSHNNSKTERILNSKASNVNRKVLEKDLKISGNNFKFVII